MFTIATHLSVALATSLCALSMGSHQASTNSLLQQYTWLLGTWAHSSKNGTVFERWVVVSEHEWFGRSYMVSENDTTVFETIRLVEHDSTLEYIPTVSDQNSGKPVVFTLVERRNDELVFENPAHDFPQRIHYTRVTADSLVAEISGMVKGARQARRFPMSKVSE